MPSKTSHESIRIWEIDKFENLRSVINNFHESAFKKYEERVRLPTFSPKPEQYVWHETIERHGGTVGARNSSTPD